MYKFKSIMAFHLQGEVASIQPASMLLATQNIYRTLCWDEVPKQQLRVQGQERPFKDLQPDHSGPAHQQLP